MQTLEIGLGESIDSRKEVVKSIIGRVVIVNHTEFGKVKGRIIGLKESYFELRRPSNDTAAFFMDAVYDMSYHKVQSMALVNPTAMDCIEEARKNYHS